ncbi:MAG: hypothetical protein GY739_12055, partial [Mesoflavibacter sp.]|nr:hypothetical protein [Mesoflavibacter sp.]
YRNAIQYLEVDSEIMEVYTVTSDVISLEEAIENDFAVDVAPKKKDLIKAGFNPNQPRDRNGQWGSGGLFPNSKVRDKEGNLIKVYHGTDADITEFQLTGDKWASKVGFWFSTDRQFSELYGDNIVEVYLDITNPKIIDFSILDDWRMDYHNNLTFWTDKRNEWIKLGFDGLMVKGQKQEFAGFEMPINDFWVAFENSQIKILKKSLIKAGFDPNQPRNPDGTWGSGGSVNTDYRGSHQIGYDEDYNSTLDDLLNGEAAPRDIYENPHHYMFGSGKDYKESWAAILKAKGKPNMMIKIYRGVPKGVAKINSGDWITLSPTYALQHSWDMHGAGKDGDVIEM